MNTEHYKNLFKDKTCTFILHTLMCNDIQHAKAVVNDTTLVEYLLGTREYPKVRTEFYTRLHSLSPFLKERDEMEKQNKDLFLLTKDADNKWKFKDLPEG